MLPALAILLIGLPSAILPQQDLYLRARAAMDRGQVDSAYTLIQRAADAEPDRAEVHFWLGEIAGARAGRVGGIGALSSARKSKAGFARALELEPNNPRYIEGLAGYLSQAPGIAGGDRDSAIALCERLMTIDARRGTLVLAQTLRTGNNRQKARADTVMDGFARTYADRAGQIQAAQYWGATDRRERALAIYQALVRRDSADALSRYGVARNLVVLAREPRVAQAHLRYVLDQPLPPAGQPRWAAEAAWWLMGQAYVQLGMTDSARLAFEQSLLANERFMPARRSLDSLGRR